MTITSYCLAVGKVTPNSQVFKHVLDKCPEFRKEIEEIFDDENCVAVFNQFYEFLEDGAPGENNPEKWKGDEYDELFNVYNDWAISLADYHWILPSGKKLQIIHIPHDINEDDSSIVGKIVVDNIRQSKLAEIDIEKLNDIKNTRDQLELSGEFSGTKLYIVPDDCACCT